MDIKKIVIFPLIALSVLSLSACKPSNKDPKTGVVDITDYLWKRCDGTTLIYGKLNALSTIPNSPECR